MNLLICVLMAARLLYLQVNLRKRKNKLRLTHRPKRLGARVERHQGQRLQ